MSRSLWRKSYFRLALHIAMLVAVIIASSVNVSAAGSPLSEDSVKDLLKTWLMTQNTGQFGNYAKLYAKQFHGVRRSGGSIRKFNRSEWLEDRERMFRKKMSVAVSNTGINISGTTAYIHFRQSWQSGSYSDLGDKVLVVTAEEGSMRITREEMLDSVIASKVDSKETFSLDLAFAMREGIVIASYQLDPSNIKVKPELDRRQDLYVASVPIEANTLPLRIQSLLGRSMRIYGERGSCEATITGFKLVSKEVPHQSKKQSWAIKGSSDQEIASSVFISGNRHLVATTTSCSGDFATAGALPPVGIFPSSRPDTETGKAVKIALISLPMYKKYIQPHELAIEKETIKLFKVRLKGKSSSYVSAFISAGDACGNGGALGALWRLDESAAGPKLTWIKYLPEDPLYAADVDSDGFADFYCHSKYTGYSGFISGRIKGDPGKRGGFTDNGNLFFQETALHDDPC